ncbi:MAG: DUF1292 domain-containing protein [Clostridia bacterium]|nr:DUF1292 domain-containing protein [Clostridia bacterium]
MEDNYNPEFICVSDEDGTEYVFEVLDRIDTDDGKQYIAVVPTDGEEDDDTAENIELIILEVTEENGDPFLSQIEDDDEYDKIEELFLERLSEFYDIDEEE